MRKSLFVLAAVVALMFVLSCANCAIMAQTPEPIPNAGQIDENPMPPNTALAGGVINSDNTGAYQVSLAFRRTLTGPLATMTFYDVSGVKLTPTIDFTNMQYSVKQALTMRAYTPTKWLSLWLMGEAGVTGTQDVATGSAFGGGGYGDFVLGKNRNYHILVMPKAVKNTVTGTNFELRLYFGPSW